MASRYWVGGTATWDATAGTKWATTSGGAGGAAVPTAADDVFFDAASGVVTISTSGSTTDNCRSLDCTGFTGTLNHVSNTDINIGTTTPGPGNVALKLVSGMTYSGASVISNFNFVSTSTTQQTIDFGSKTHAPFNINGAGSSYLLVSASTAVGGATITLTAGTFDTNGQTCFWASITSSNSNTRTLSLGASTLTLTSTSTPIQFTTSTNLTFSAGTSAITCNGSSTSPQFGGQTFYDLAFTGGAAVTITGTFSCRNFTRTGTNTKTDSLILMAGFTCSGIFTATGNSAVNRLLVNSNTVVTTRTITAATTSITNTDFMDIAGAGAGVPFAGTSVGDCGGNSGITFTAPVTQTRSGANGSWSSAANWTSRVPLPQDDVIVNASATGTITGDMPRGGRDITFTGFAGTYNPSTTTAYFGSVIYASGMTLNSIDVINLSGRGTHTITSAGKTLPGVVAIIAPGGSYTLQDSFNSVAALTLTYGTFDANNFNVTIASLSSALANVRTLTMGSGTWTITSTSSITVWNLDPVNLTFTTNTAPIVIGTASGNTRTFAGGGKAYHSLEYVVANSPGSLVISNAGNSFNSLTTGPGRILTMTTFTTTTFSNFNATGAANGYLYLPGVSGNYISTPDSAALSITGNIDLRVRLSLNDWTPTSNSILIAKRTANTSQYSYILYIDSSGRPNMSLSANGTSATNAVSSASVPFSDNTVGWLRATWQASDGRVQFFTAADSVSMPVSWTQLGTNLTIAIASIFDGTAVLELGSQFVGTNSLVAGKLYRSQIRNNILDDGTGIVFDADLTAKAIMANSFTESSSNAATVTVNGALAQVGDGRISLTASSTSAATVSKASGIVSCDYLTIQNSTATGGATWYAGANSTNVSGNTGWIFSGAPGGGSSGSNFMPFFRS